MSAPPSLRTAHSIEQDARVFVARKQAVIAKEKARQAYMESHGVAVPRDQQDRLRAAVDEVTSLAQALDKAKKD
ncbi:hypothetical protein pclt_cds_938 [Pandoravirus celtis]|uniref:Uncharacterized protein n=1 Tax=Pandoravirus celtis TaxID=2568002 RepID=A0A4D6EIH5_9VIRU|nr:hypothetical protein pclt_cds_938 [Pandoravirus celtis]